LTHDAIVIGAGIAGLTAAQRLHAAGLNVLILDKSRGLGGRAATRRLETPTGVIAIDHGAQYFTAREASFTQTVTTWCDAGIAAVWTEELATYEHDTLRESRGAHPRYACPSGMNALGKHLAHGLAVTREATVRSVTRHADGYRVAGDGFAFDAPRVLITAPVPQGLALLSGDLGVDEALRSVSYHPCWAAALHAPHATTPAWRGIRCPDHDAVAWIANDASKRPTPSPGATLVVHAHGAWSRAHYDDAPDAIVGALTRAAAEITGLDLTDAITSTHRWRYAHIEHPHPQRHALPHPGLAFAGDAFGGDEAGRIESAFHSGISAAAALTSER
jgi:renalase